jgi:hypothetical protein
LATNQKNSSKEKKKQKKHYKLQKSSIFVGTTLATNQNPSKEKKNQKNTINFKEDKGGR